MGKGRSGKSTTKKTDVGNAIKIINLGDQEQYCVQTGKILPKRGFAWQYKDMLFINRVAAMDYEYKTNPPVESEE